MEQVAHAQPGGGMTYGSALNPLWGGLIPISGRGEDGEAAFPPALEGIDEFATRIAISGKLNGSTSALQELVETTRDDWLTESERRFVIGAKIAESLVEEARKSRTVDSDPVAIALGVVDSIAVDDRHAVLGAMLLAPEQPFRLVVHYASALAGDVPMVSSLFAIPPEVAQLRVQYDSRAADMETVGAVT